MIKEDKINDIVFIEHRTYYIYRNELDRKNDKPFLVTSNEKTFNLYKEKYKKNNP